jgi:hypothetical protein
MSGSVDYEMPSYRAALCLDWSTNQVHDLGHHSVLQLKSLKTNPQLNTHSMQIPWSEAPARIDLVDE